MSKKINTSPQSGTWQTVLKSKANLTYVQKKTGWSRTPSAHYRIRYSKVAYDGINDHYYKPILSLAARENVECMFSTKTKVLNRQHREIEQER